MDIREVARRSGVSVATVSRALNGRPDVSDATRARVVEIARTLDYEPNQTARTLVRRRSDTVGLIWDTHYVQEGRRQPFLENLLVGLKVALSDAGYHLLLLSTAELTRSGGRESFIGAARQHSLDGVVLMGVDGGHPGVAALVESRLPCVAFDQSVAGPRAASVTSDNRAGARSAVEHLIGLGHRRIATVTGLMKLSPARDRLAGYRDALAAAGIAEHPGYVEHGDFFLASGQEAVGRLLALPERPTAIFAAGDEMAIGGFHAIGDAGLSVPGDVAVVGFDDLDAAAHVRPPLSSVAQDHLALGRAAVRVLLGFIDDATENGERPVAPGVAEPRVVRLPTRLVVRGSSGGAIDRP
jgi:LacI family transcriptional regulator